MSWSLTVCVSSSTLLYIMSEILLTPLPEPISPVDPDMDSPRRAPSQSTEFFNSLYVEGVRGHTRPLQVRKKPADLNSDLFEPFLGLKLTDRPR
jgi:hypothetical protein